MSSAFDDLLKQTQDYYRLQSVGSLLGWDRETYMPERAAADRAEQMALLSGLLHDRMTSDRLAGAITAAAAEINGADSPQAAIVRELRRDHERATKLPRSLVEDIARTTSLAISAWTRARKESDFALFAPHLERIIDLKRQEADHVGYDTERYDALMDEYEVGARAAVVGRVFDELRPHLVALVQAISSAPRQPDLGILKRSCPVDAQQRFNRVVAEAIGFDFAAGRIDISTHPFCSGFTPSDVRLTTRYDEFFMPMSLFGILHEAGHGLYEQGLSQEFPATPLSDSISLGVHESQSRMWENQVGRSRAFWEHFFVPLQQTFPALADVALDDWYFAVNSVQPSLIRVEADEVTYGLHIMLRFDLERRLIDGKLAVKDVPAAWNAGMQELLGITPPRDAEGCLQDIHWSSGIFGYFPTYQLGNIYSAQFFAAARRDIPELEQQFRTGHFAPLLEWLRSSIHRHGRRYTPTRLLERTTGRGLDAEPYLAYLHGKFKPLYGIS